MKKTQVEMTEEELKQWEAVRLATEKQKAEQDDEQKTLQKRQDAKAERKAKAAALEPKFRNALDEASVEIEKFIENARAELGKAIAVSEQYGIPFQSTIVDVAGDTARVYVPRSYSKYWRDLDLEEIDSDGIEFLLYQEDLSPGWEYWSTSSLSC